MGDNETGKTTLIAKLQGVEDPKKGSALEYAYIDVRDEYRDGEYETLLAVLHKLVNKQTVDVSVLSNLHYHNTIKCFV